MAKIKNEDYIRDAIALCDRLALVKDLNRCSRSLLDVSRMGIESNDGRWAWEKASSAAYMDYFCNHIAGKG